MVLRSETGHAMNVVMTFRILDKGVFVEEHEEVLEKSICEISFM